MAYFAKGVFAADPWARREILTLAAFQERGDDLPSPLGLRLDPGSPLEAIVGALPTAALIAIAFPKFVDGRGYSMGWLLRSRYGYKGEMRATGDVLFDELQFMDRCGFDAFEITDPATLDLLRAGRGTSTFDRFYQPSLERQIPEGTRPWARRRPPAEAGT